MTEVTDTMMIFIAVAMFGLVVILLVGIIKKSKTAIRIALTIVVLILLGYFF